MRIGSSNFISSILTRLHEDETMVSVENVLSNIRTNECLVKTISREICSYLVLSTIISEPLREVIFSYIFAITGAILYLIFFSESS